MKISRKARNGRHRSFPEPHKDHRRRPVYDRFARLWRIRLREGFAHEQAISELQVATSLHPRTGTVQTAGALPTTAARTTSRG